MKKYGKVMVSLILGFSLVGCSNSMKISPTTSAIKELPSKTMDSYDGDLESIEQDAFKNVEFNNDSKLNLKEGALNFFQSSDRKYAIEDKKYKQGEHKGKFNVSYPVLKDTRKDMTVVNSVILARVVNELYYEDEENVMDIDLNYEIKIANDNFISILFTGFYNTHGAAHPNNISFTINFDLKNNKPLSLYDVAALEDNMLEKVHGAMKSQLKKEGVEAFEKLPADELDQQIYDKDEGFYIENEKIYIRFSIMVGAGYHEYISFDIACNGKAKKADSTEIQENITEAPEESQHTQWKIVEKKKYYCIEKMGIRKYNDYFKCTVYNEQQDAIYSEILGEFNEPPTISVSDDTVDIHYGYGTDAFCDKFINYKENLQSVWLDNVWGSGKQYVAYVIGDWQDGTKSKLVIEKKYEQNTKKEYPFPHIIYDADVDKCEFRKNETELYVHYIDKDTKKEMEKTIKRNEFK